MDSPEGVARFAALWILFGVRLAPTGLVLQILPVERDELGLTLELLHGAAALERRVVVIKLLSLTGLWRSFHTRWKRRTRNQRLPLAGPDASGCQVTRRHTTKLVA